MISAPNDRRSAGVSWSERWSPKSPNVVRMNPTMASMWATSQAVEANAAAPCKEVSSENGRSAG